MNTTQKLRNGMLEAGEGVVDITPPLGIELAGFHRAPGNERLITGIRQPTSTRALVLRCNAVETAIVSIEVPGVSRDFVKRVQARVAEQVQIPAEHVRICVTHTHSMPALCYYRQWGAIPPQAYVEHVEQSVVQAVELAKSDLTPAELYVGKAQVVGGNFNRTSETWKTDELFTTESSDEERWLDTMLHALHFQRGADKQGLLWYHFSAHPVCYTDGNAGPDWVGIVAEQTRSADGLAPAFLQGHCGDVNPGDGTPSWLGVAEEVAEPIYNALHHALNTAERVDVSELKISNAEIEVPLNIELFKAQLAQYTEDPGQCTGGEWVDAGFAQDWFEGAQNWDLQQTSRITPISAIQLGEVGLLFHPAELYSYYGLEIRHNAPFQHTLVVGYADDFIGYLTDPAAHATAEYAAIVVPKIVDLPPFTPDAARIFTDEVKAFLHRVA